ncbi:MAG: cysteine desulfurase family protein, partial [Gammaproteobacteria bacterium]|nr:cysteine desulfurase family protein [Gammaproteobacteria bacterium]
ARAGGSRRRRIVTLATEHAAVLETVADLGRTGFEACVLPVQPTGLVDLNRLEDAVDENTLVVSAMAVNNEIGAIQPLAEIGSICRRRGALFHSDATQAPARIEVDVDAWGVDLLSLSAHKIYGPKGIGALYVADDATIRGVSTGGGQERGMRPGTVPTPLACGFGVAAELAVEEQPADAVRLERLGERLRLGVEAMATPVHHFGTDEHRAPGTLSFGFQGIAGDHLVALVESDIAISTGAACSSADASVSHVLAALGCSRAIAATGVRVGLGRYTTDADVEVAVGALRRASAGAAGKTRRFDS